MCDKTPIFSIEGTVIKGRQMGHTWGFPTINVPMKDKPEFLHSGVYFSEVTFDGEVHYAITNIGVKPTIEGVNGLGAETFIYDYEGDLYDREVRIDLYHYNRPECKFSSIDELKLRIGRDIEEGRSYFGLTGAKE
ncbi:MAG: riboflavin kinase [Lachnospiraceae bacterium]|nr:riboflavin kinase [Lachnospiraceae bacterium]